MDNKFGYLRPLEDADIEDVVSVHLSSFPGFFLSFLGSRFLSLFYYGVGSAPEGISFVYLNEAGMLAGFVAGTSNPGGFYSRLLKRYWLRFALASLVPVLKRPSTIQRVARAIFHPSGNPIGDDVAGLFSIGVRPEFQGSGAGKRLVHAFLDEARRRGCKRIFLTTDRDNNDAVNYFYLTCGFMLERQYVTPEGRKMNEYWLSL